MDQGLSPEEGNQLEPLRKPRRRRRLIQGGCLVLFVVVCTLLGGLGLALRTGPVQVGLPGNTSLRLGSDNFVLSNYSFQNGTTYYADLSGSGVRNILEIHLLSDARRLEIVVHYATHAAERDDHLLDLSIP